MNKRIFTLLSLLTLCTSFASAQSLFLRHRDGSSTILPLSSSPKVETGEEQLTITSTDGTVRLSNDDVLGMAFRTRRSDVNLDYHVDISDVVSVINDIADSGNARTVSDVNIDGKTDISDIVAIINDIAGTGQDGETEAPSFAADRSSSVGDAIYVYRNDGEFNAFLRYEVEQITFDRSMQVQTPDSTYEIPLSAIDSVSFIQPETRFKPRVMRMSDSWLPYIVSADEASIVFRSDTPSEYVPTTGQVIVAETFGTPLEDGFAGRVTSVASMADGIRCEVEDVTLSDIYDHIVMTGVSSSYNEEEEAASVRSRVFWHDTDKGVRFPLPKVDISAGPFSVSCTPSLVLKYIVCVGEQNLKDYVDIRIYDSFSGSIDVNCDIKGGYTPEPWWLAGIPITTDIPALYGSVQFGGFVRAEGGVKVSASIPFSSGGVNGFTADDTHGIRGVHSRSGGFNLEDSNISFSLDGSVSGGLAVRLEFGLICKKLASADVTAYIGPKLSGTIDLATAPGALDGGLYSTIKDSKMTLSLCADLVPGYRFWGKDHKELPGSLSLGYDINSWYVVPSFSSLKYDGKGTSGKLSGKISRNLLPKVSLGWVLYDESGEVYKTEYFSETYRKLEDWGRDGLEHSLSGLPSGKSFTAYPAVKLFGIEMRADQSVLINSLFPVVIRSFEVTKSQYKQGGFSNDGKTYDYRFDAATTVACASTEGLSDWGYVYEDPNGKKAHISLKSKGSPYTDTAYAYFRNSKQSTCRLYGYVKYEDDDEYYYGDPQDYELKYEEQPLCPDSNHPHAIDLGIGVKWACCNVGASSPDEYGCYYAWGETEEKSYYNWETYKYYNSSTGYQSLGSDIAGTHYDVAHVKWGGGWRMPSYDQIIDLFNQCTSEWTTLNGVKGRKFTGPNGASIFLPAAGNRWSDNTNYAGSHGYCWSSTQGPDNSSNACYLSFYSGYVDWSSNTRYYGQSVRPVTE